MGNFISSSTKKISEKLHKTPRQELHSEEKQHIKNYVKRLLENKTINNSFIPDEIEQVLYEEVLEIIVSKLKHFLSTSSIEILDHEIQFSVIPKKILTSN
jgi:hypothetical protein